MVSWFTRSGRFIGAAGFLLSLILGGCNPQPIPEASGSVLTPVRTATLSPTLTTEPPTPAPATIGPPPSPTSIHTSTPTAVGEPTANSDPPTETPPPPTFTPPPPPPPLEYEQLWLQRPVPVTSPSWTDKTYPYGSTRGGRLRPHTGVEFIIPTGTPVLATAPGTVLVAGDDSLTAYGPQTDFYGNLVIIELDQTIGGLPIYTLHGHLSEVSVAAGQRVATGDALGLSGASGVADGPHLHFEVRLGANSYTSTRNPLLWLAPLRETGVVAGRVVGSNGELLYEAPVSLIRIDAPAPYTATTSYALGEPNSDGSLMENFVVDDVVPGFYQVIVDAGSRQFKKELWVYPGRVNWVDIIVGS